MNNLIVLEGLDGSGKATQAERVHDALCQRGNPVRRIEFPDYQNPSSSLIKMYLGGEFGTDPHAVNAYQASCFYAVDRVASYLRDWREDYRSGTTVLTDRYTTSNAIYQLTKLPKEEWRSFLDWLEDFEYKKLALPKPDMVLYLDVEPGVSQLLMDKRYSGDPLKKDIHERDFSFLQMCRKSALYAAGQQGWRIIGCSENGRMKPVEHITEEILAHLF